MTRALLIFIIATSLTTIASAREELNLSKGTMSAGGIISFPIEWDPVRKASFSLNLSPEFGIFLADNFQLLARAHLKTAFFGNGLKLGARDALWHWGLGLGGEYMFNYGWPVVPFVGFGFDMGMSKLIVTTATAQISLPVGILVPLNKHVALSFGVATRVSLIAQLKVLERVSFEPGCLGIRAFF